MLDIKLYIASQLLLSDINKRQQNTGTVIMYFTRYFILFCFRIRVLR